MHRVLISFFFLITLSSCALTKSPAKEIEKTWRFSVAMLPAKYSAMEMTGTAPGFYEYSSIQEWSDDIRDRYLVETAKKLPVILHLHGCTGIGPDDSTWADVYADMGYLTILPNSFRRSNRKSYCQGGRWQERLLWRSEELEYAKQQISKIPWIDKDNMFLSGYSEGGHTVSSYKGDRFAAHIILGSDCSTTEGSPESDKSIPVLNIVGSDDHYGYGKGCDLNRKIGGSRVVIVEGGGHDISHETKARKAAKSFLEHCCVK